MLHLDTSWSVQETLFFFAELGRFQGRGHDQDHMRGSQKSRTKGGVTPDLQASHHIKTLAKSQGQCLVRPQFSDVMEFALHQGHCRSSPVTESACLR